MKDKGRHWYSIRDVAEIVGVSDETIRKHIKAGQFPGARKKSPLPRSSWMIPDDALADYRRRIERT